MVSILVDPSFFRSVWCTRLLDGLSTQLKQKRQPFQYIESLNALDAKCGYVYLVGADEVWMRAAVAACDRAGAHPIVLCNQAHHTFEYNYSTVCADVMQSMRHLVGKLRDLGRGRVALYGINPQSISDQSRLDGYLAAIGGQGRENVFYNTGSLERCYLDYAPRADSFDAVVCANTFAAISLVRRLKREHPHLLDELMVFGYAEVLLSRLYVRDIHTVSVNFSEFGKASVMLLDSLRKNPCLSHIIMAIQWDMASLDSPRARPNAPERPDAPLELPPSRDAFYEDPELNEMMCLERLLYDAEDVDREIIRGLLTGKSYEKIAEAHYLTVSTVKYRLRRMIGICRLKSRDELLALLRRYMPPEWVHGSGAIQSE